MKVVDTAQRQEKKTVLVVDDDPHIVELIKDTLGTTYYSLMGAYNGQQALEVLQTEKVDLVVADIILAEDMSGYDICKRIKENKDMSRIPVIMLSAKGQMEDKINAVDAGADDYMVKPFDPGELAKRVRLNLHLHF